MYSTGVAVATTNPTEAAQSNNASKMTRIDDCQQDNEQGLFLQMDNNEIIREMMMKRNKDGLNLRE